MEFINIPAWSAREVLEWLKGLDDSLHQYERRFLSKQITGQQLLQFSSDYFDKLNISKVGHQQLLRDAIQHLSHLHNNLTTENLQSIALSLEVKAGDLGSHLRGYISQDDNNHGKDWLKSEPVLRRITETVTAAKLIISWLDRPPFKNVKDFQVVREDILQYALALTQETDLKRISETSQEIKEICDKLVKKATDPLIIQAAYIEIVTLKRKKPDEELGLELRTNALDGSHIIIAANTATPGGRKVTFGDEVLQVNYQTVVGWDHKKVIQALIANPTEVALTLKKRPRNLNQAGQLLRPSRHQIQAGGLSSLPRRKHPGNTLHPPSTKDDLYLRTLENQQESEKKPPVLKKQPSHSDSEPHEPENKLLRLRRCPTMGEAVLRRPSPKKSKETSGEGRPRSLPLDTLEVDVSTEDLRHWLERQANKSEPHGKSAEQLSPRDPERKKKTVRILDLNGNTFRTGESVKGGVGDSTTEISLKIPQKAIMANNTAASHQTGRPGPVPGGKERSAPDVSRGHSGKEQHPNNLGGGNLADSSAVVRRKDLSRVADRGSYDSKCSSGSSSEGFVYWEESLEEPGAGFREMAVDVPEDFNPPKSRYTINPDYAVKTGVVRRSKEKKSRRKMRLSRRITCVDLGSGECEGWLQKRNENKFPKQWVYMLFKLKEFVLYYYKTKDAAKAKGLICLPGYKVQRHDKKDWGIKIFHEGLDKTIYLAAEKESDWKRWMEHLQLASILYTEKDKEKDKRKSQILPEEFDVMKTVNEDFIGYHSESDDAESVIVDDPDYQPDQMTKALMKETFARRSVRRKSTHNVGRIYEMQTKYHPDSNLNEMLAKKHMLSRTMESKRKDVEELDRLLAQKITKTTFQAWQHDHPNLLQEIHRSRAPSERRDYSSEEEGSIASDRSDPGTASGGSPLGSRASPDSASLSGSPQGSRKQKPKDHRARAMSSPSNQKKKAGDKHGSPLRKSTPTKSGNSRAYATDTWQSASINQGGGELRSQTGGLPSQTRGLPSESRGLPSQTGGSKSQTEGIPSQTGGLPSQTGGLASQTGVSPSPTEESPSQTGVSPSQTGGSVVHSSRDPSERLPEPKGAGTESLSGSAGVSVGGHHKHLENSANTETPGGVPPSDQTGARAEAASPQTSPEHHRGRGGPPTSLPGEGSGYHVPTTGGDETAHTEPRTPDRKSPTRHAGKRAKGPPPLTSPKPKKPQGSSSSHRLVGIGSPGAANKLPLKPQKSTEIDVAAAATAGGVATSPKKVPPKVKERRRAPRARTDSETSETSV